MYIPVAVIVCSQVVYQLCAKSTSHKINPFASLALTYAIGALVTTMVYYVSSPERKLLAEFQHINWATVVLGIAIVGLEAGNIFMYKVGWDISLGPLVTSSLSAVALLLVGVIAYGEGLSLTKVIGVVLCLGGLILLNQK